MNKKTEKKTEATSVKAKNVQGILTAKYGKVRLNADQKAAVEKIVFGIRGVLDRCVPCKIEDPTPTDKGYSWNNTDYASKTQAFAAFKAFRSETFGGVQGAIDKAIGALKVEGYDVKASDLLVKVSWKCLILKGDNAGRTHGIGSYIGVNTDLVKLLVFNAGL